MPQVPLSINKMRQDAQTVVHLTCSEGSGTTTADATGNGRTGTLVAPAAWGTAANPGRHKQTLYFPGSTGQYVAVQSDAGMNPASFSLAAWLALDGAGNYPIITTKYNPGHGTENGYEFRCSGATKKLELVISDGTSLNYVTGLTALTLGKWYHVVGTYDGAYLRVYLNGVQDNYNTSTLTLPGNTLALQLGDRSFPGNWLTGRIDDFLIRSTAWTAAEIATEFQRLTRVVFLG